MITKFNRIRVEDDGPFSKYRTVCGTGFDIIECKHCSNAIKNLKGVPEFVLPYAVREREVEKPENKWLKGRGLL